MPVKQQQTHKPILVLGAGSWGTALALCLARNNVPTRLWSYDPEQAASMQATRENATYLPGIPLLDNIEVLSDLEQALDGIEDVMIVVPSFGLLNPGAIWVLKFTNIA